MEAKHKVGDVVQLTLAVKQVLGANAPRYVVEKVHDHRTPQLQGVEFYYDLVEEGFPNNTMTHISESSLKQTKDSL